MNVAKPTSNLTGEEKEREVLVETLRKHSQGTLTEDQAGFRTSIFSLLVILNQSPCPLSFICCTTTRSRCRNVTIKGGVMKLSSLPPSSLTCPFQYSLSNYQVTRIMILSFHVFYAKVKLKTF